MNNFNRKKIQSLTLGERMKKIRSNKRASLNDIYKATMIQVEHLESLEKGEYDKLPADVYVKGFLKSFANYMNVETKELINLFEKEKNIRKNIQNLKKDKKKKKLKLVNFSITPKIISAFFISAFFVMLMGYFYDKLDNFISNPALVILNPEEKAHIANNSVSVSGKTDRGNKVFINNQSVLVNNDGSFKEIVILKKGINLISVKSVNRFNKEAVKVIPVEVE